MTKKKTPHTSTLRVLVYRPGCDAELLSINNTLQTMQALVDGYIEVVRLTDKLVVVCNELGRYHELPKNLAGFVGTFFVVRDEGADFASLTDSDIVDAYDALAALHARGGVR